MDEHAQVRDMYFPYVGLENHIGGQFKHRVGAWVDGKMRWFDEGWDITLRSEDEAPVGSVLAKNSELDLTMYLSDTVYNEKNVFLRKIIVKNTSSRTREVKLYFGHEFKIYGSERGDTAYFDPVSHTVIHYNGRRVFLINGLMENRSFDDYTTGIFHIEGRAGSYKNAENGFLPKNPIEHGPTDSVIGFYGTFTPGEEKTIYYWVTIGESIKEVHDLNRYVIEKTSEYMLHTTRDFWRAWVNRYKYDFDKLDPRVITLFKKSLFTIRAHADNRGSILASGDSHMLLFGKDSYEYCWPRDGALVALSLDLVGNTNIARHFFQFCNTVINEDGYLMHKYRPDGSLGSSWHPWVRNGKTILPIQEDETALVVHALWNHYEISRDLEFVESIYNSFIKKAAEFMIIYRDKQTGLPKPSYDPWEEKYGISTYTSSTVIAGLLAAAKFAKILGKGPTELRYRKAAEEIREALIKNLWDEKEGYFYKMINVEEGMIVYDKTLDISSFYGLVGFNILDIDDEKLTRFAEVVNKRLMCHTAIGGFARYEGDQFFRIKNDRNVPGNPWIITTLWMAQYYITKAKSNEELEEARKWIAWVVNHATLAGMLSEQIDPYNGAPLSAMPLTWSHAEFVTTIIRYLDKLEELKLCVDCNPVNR
jgi:oligosaccharide amylase